MQQMDQFENNVQIDATLCVKYDLRSANDS